MRAFAALLIHEIKERKALLVAAAVASVLPLLAPLLPATGSNPAADIREAVLWFVVATLIPVFAVLLGATFIGRDLSEGRLGFFFAQPMSAPAIWFAKLGAVVMLVWAAQLILMLPTALLSGDAARILLKTIRVLPDSGVPLSLLTVWVGPVVLILIAHSVGVVWRARSPWIVLDFVAFVVIVGATRFVLGPFLMVFAAGVVMTVVGWILASAFVALIVGGAVQLIVGRVDAKRGHRALSGTLWIVMTIAVTSAACWGWWVRSATPEDLSRVYEISLGAGSWIGVTGASAGRMDFYPGFLINTHDGRWIAAHFGSDVHERGVIFSADMSRAVWTVPAGPNESQVLVADLNRDSVEKRRTGIVLNRQWRGIALSDDGSRLAAIEGANVVAYEVGSGDLLAAAKVGDGFIPAGVRFDSDDVVAVLAFASEKSVDDSSGSRRRWRQHRFGIETRHLDEGRVIDSPWQWVVPGWNSAFGYTLERRETAGENRLQLVDPAIGTVVADLGDMPGRWSDIEVVDDGRMVLLRQHAERPSLEIVSPDGRNLCRVDLPGQGWLKLGGEVGPHLLAIGWTTWSGEGETPTRQQTLLVDLDEGAITRTFAGVSPVLGGWRNDTSPGAWDIGSVATRMMEGEGFTLSLWEPDTDELHQLIPFPD